MDHNIIYLFAEVFINKSISQIMLINSGDERKLVEGCIAGNRAMQNKLYEKYAAVMMGICLRYTLSYHDAEEILQEGFIKVFTSLNSFKFKGSLEGWIKRVIVNCALEKLRKARHMYPLITIDKIENYCTTRDLAIGQFSEKELLRLIQQLPSMYRLVFNLYVFENYKHREIAELLNISVGTSKSNLYEARLILQRSLTGNFVTKSSLDHEKKATSHR